MKLNAGRSLSQLKYEAKRALDEETERVRDRFVTSAPGQIMAYQHKAREARAFMADFQTIGPHLAAEVGVTGQTPYQVATIILFKEEQWLTRSAAIEAARLTAKNQIDAAQTVAEIRAVSVDWPAVLAPVLSS
jgi:vacuolar-type H+-ATPase subunit H